MASSATEVFRHPVRAWMGPPPLSVAPGTPVAELVARMTASGAGEAVVVDADGSILGILTEQDVTRRVACRGVGGQPVEAFMSAPVRSVEVDRHLYEAIGYMRRHGLRHLPVADARGRPLGMLHLDAALGRAAGPLAEHIDRLTHEGDLPGLARVKAAQVELARDLFDDGVAAPEVLALISDINNDIHRRVLRLILAAMAEEGRGPPPVAFDCIVMGSGGRGESALFPDQDHGFVLEDYPDRRHGGIDPWFTEAADRLGRHLDRLGFPLCRGGVMAINPVWRKTLGQWREQLLSWMRRRHESMLLSSDIFFDFRPVFGEGRMAGELRAFATVAAREHPRFLREMFAIQADHHAAIGLFGRLRLERAATEHRGQLNLKLGGTLPLAEAVRLLALKEGVAATGTLTRIAALRAGGRLSADEAYALERAFAFITGQILRRQISDYQQHRPVGSFVDPRALAASERQELKAHLRAINEFRTRLRSELTGELV
ncbi:putative nucleotidyltransferase substrate binding domain-containing protein [Geminicoccaceae bacterium 1502E]|nr:putative nucleotidyltransferase substrate binding domain-containing protein [Geminicoccaceae bacterium 1502E]